jgi:hypothetical protein
MSVELLTGEQMDRYEQVWVRVMIVSAVSLCISLFGVYLFWSGGTELLVFGIVAVVSLFATLIAAAKLRELDRGTNETDRESRGEMHTALDDFAD